MFGGLISWLMENMLYFALHMESGTVFPKPLSAQQEAEAFRRMAEGDTSARSELIEHNLRLVAHVVKKYYTSNADTEELISIGTVGLIKAVSTFNNSKSTRFATYAAKCIDNMVDRIDTMIKSRQLYGFVENSLDDREREIILYRYGLYGKKPLTQREVAEKLDISRSYVSRIEKKALEKLKNEYEK